uniref:Gastrin/cholecystokinin peptide hormone domain-containing protein n=1 Tax=Esox lucius TaxID=8010 RepID=A0A3P8XF79_ESOLU
MNVGICVCVLLAALSSSGMGRPSHPQDKGKAALPRLDAPLSSQLTTFSKPTEDEGETRTSLSELLARLISRKGSFIVKNASGPGPSHRIKDRDYLGWMDFGRRSAEEYEEYSS